MKLDPSVPGYGTADQRRSKNKKIARQIKLGAKPSQFRSKRQTDDAGDVCPSYRRFPKKV